MFLTFRERTFRSLITGRNNRKKKFPKKKQNCSATAGN